jgi:hypothetical protein
VVNKIIKSRRWNFPAFSGVQQLTLSLLALCVFLWPVLLSAAEVSARLDRSRIVQGETVTLILETNDPKQSLDASLSGLEQDFAILDRRSETQMSIVNGRQSAEVRTMIVLEPKRSGNLKIPVLSVGGSATQPLAIRVDPAPQPEPGELPPVFIEVEVSPADPPYFVHAQLGLIVRVFYQQNLTEAAISQPEPSPASVRLLDEVPFQAERNGVRYRVLERHYAIFPERSGDLLIPPLQLSGRLVERRSDRLWQPTVRGRRIQVSSDPVQLTIQARPSSFSGNSWQPARNLELSQQISAGGSLRVGEPVTRTVIVDAVGLEENMITEPAWPDIPNARIYPDQPQGISRDDGQWVLGHKEFRYAIVPEQEGELVLTELKVHWWDTVNNRQQTAVLPAKRIEVQASAVTPVAQPEAVVSDTPAVMAGNGEIAGVVYEPGYWRWLAILFAILWLLTLAVAWRLRGLSELTPNGVGLIQSEDEKQILKQLQRFCEKNNAGQARQALANWLAHFGPDSDSSGSLLEFAAGLQDESLCANVRAMDSDGYRPDQQANWNSKQFWKQFEAWRKSWRAAMAAEKPPVTDLYAKANRRTR